MSGAGIGGGGLGRLGGAHATPKLRAARALAPAQTTAPSERDAEMNTENYAHIAEKAFLSVASQPLSTFSIDVDTASYSNSRRFLAQGALPPKDAIRIEEWVNYFSYDYAKPTGNAPFAVSTEVTSCPWNARHKLVRIGIKGQELREENVPARNLVFLLDVSGSMMSPDKLPLVKRGLSMMKRVAIADEWWALDFGCSVDALRPVRAQVQAHSARLTGNPGIWMLVAGGAPLISMPADVFASHGERAMAWTSALVSDEARLLQELSGLAAGRVGKVIGSAPIHYGSAASLDLRDAVRATSFAPEAAVVSELRDACGEAWDDGGSELSEGVPLFGAFDDTNRLAALASYKVWNGAIAHIYVITHPERRGRGFGARSRGAGGGPRARRLARPSVSNAAEQHACDSRGQAARLRRV